MKINVGYDNKLDNGDILNGTPQDFFTNPSDYRHGTPPHAWLNLVTHLRDYCNINSIELNIQPCSHFLERDEKFIYPLGTSYGPEYWLGLDDDYKHKLFEFIPSRVKEHIIKGKVLVVLDLSFEGFPLDYNHHNAGYFNVLDEIHKRLTSEKFPEKNFVFYNANMLSIEKYSEYWDIEKKCNIIEVLHNERMVRDQIELQLPIYFDEMYNYKKDNLEKIKYYLWLCRRKRSYRIAMTAGLNQRNIIDKGLVSFSLDSEVNIGDMSKKRFLNEHSYPYNKDISTSAFFEHGNIEELVDKTPFIADVEDFSPNLSMVFNRALYDNTFFNLLSETHFDVRTIFLSEKVFKCVAWYSPILFMTTPGSIEKFESLGYKSFEPFINQEYDKEENNGKRLKMILDECERICEMDSKSMLDWYKDQREILEHNYNIWTTKNSYYQPAKEVAQIYEGV